MAQLEVGSLPICGTDEKPEGMLTDRYILVNVIAVGKDPDRVTAGDLA
ncbi:hypothetical protein [Streptomyces xanthophaeus]